MDLLRPKTRVFELSTKTVDNFVDFFLTLAPGNGLVRIPSLCRNIEQHHYSFKFNNLNKQCRVKGFWSLFLARGKTLCISQALPLVYGYYLRNTRLYECTVSTSAVTLSGGVNWEMPWPRLKT